MNDNILLLVLIVSCGVLIMLIGFFLLFHRSQSRIAEQQQRLQEEKLVHHRQLIKAAIASQDAERKRIGQDLHDEIGAALAVLRLTIDQCQANLDVDGFHHFLQSCKIKIDDIVSSCRNISHNLSPEILTINTLTESIEELCHRFSIAIKITLEGNDEVWTLLDTLTEDKAIHIYRILEEALHNTVKHAEASSVNIGFATEAGQLQVVYQDNGKGINHVCTKSGHGLKHIESRLLILNATYAPLSDIDHGYQLSFSFPLESSLSEYKQSNTIA